MVRPPPAAERVGPLDLESGLIADVNNIWRATPGPAICLQTRGCEKTCRFREFARLDPYRSVARGIKGVVLYRNAITPRDSHFPETFFGANVTETLRAKPTITRDLQVIVERTAIDWIRQNPLPCRQPDQSNLYICTTIVSAGERLPIPIADIRDAKRAPRPVVVVFVDDAPGRNWGHACRYLLFDANTAEHCGVYTERLPPGVSQSGRLSQFQLFHESVTWSATPARRTEPRHSAFEQSATGVVQCVLFGGDPEKRHFNDFEFLFRALNARFGVNAKLRVLFANSAFPGVHWPKDTSSDIYTIPMVGRGGKKELRSAVTDAVDSAGDPDDVLLFVNGHGLNDGIVCYIATGEPVDYQLASPAELADWLNQRSKPNPFRHLAIAMGQCSSAVFANTCLGVTSARSVSFAASCERDEESSGGGDFNSFGHEWISAFSGATANGLPVNPPQTPWFAMREIFIHARLRTASESIHPRFEHRTGHNHVLGLREPHVV